MKLCDETTYYSWSLIATAARRREINDCSSSELRALFQLDAIASAKLCSMSLVFTFAFLFVLFGYTFIISKFLRFVNTLDTILYIVHNFAYDNLCII